jgi:hypothetical protein
MFQVRNLLLFLIVMATIKDVYCNGAALNKICEYDHVFNIKNPRPQNCKAREKNDIFALNGKHLWVLPSASVR